MYVGIGRSWANLHYSSKPICLIVQDACKYFLYESGFALFVAFLINVAMISVSGTVCSANDLSKDNVEHCNDLTLNSASFLLKVFDLIHY